VLAISTACSERDADSNECNNETQKHSREGLSGAARSHQVLMTSIFSHEQAAGQFPRELLEHETPCDTGMGDRQRPGAGAAPLTLMEPGKCGTGRLSLPGPMPVSWFGLAQTSGTSLALLTSHSSHPGGVHRGCRGEGHASALLSHVALTARCWAGTTHRSGSEQREN